MSDSDQILDKYAQLKLDLKLKEEEKQRKIQKSWTRESSQTI